MRSLGTVLWEPSPTDVAHSQVGRFATWLSRRVGRTFNDFRELQRWSVADLEGFWSAVWDWFDLGEQPNQVLCSHSMPGAHWFPGARVNYAREVLARAPKTAPVLVCVDEETSVREISQESLRRQVEALATTLRNLGVEPGDRVVGFLGNTEEAVTSLLACAAVGAVWSVCSPDLGTRAVIDRLAQLEPVLLIASDSYTFAGTRRDRTAVVDELCAALPSLRATIYVTSTHGTAEPGVMPWREAVASTPTSFDYADLPFDHPLWILYTSGTTGVPKGVVHSHGGIVVEHLKSLQLTCDIGAGDRLFFYCSTNWMVWNWMLGALLAGASVVLYDGSPTHPDYLASWRVADAARATVFGTGAAYLSGTRSRGLHPRSLFDLSALRTVISTGSPLPPTVWEWVYDEFGAQIRLDCSTGGTDVCGTFMAGSPWLPVYLGELSGACLGVDAQAYSPEGSSVTGEVGELVIVSPMPSMPIAFWNDSSGERYREAYFAQYPGVWRHGDWVEITDRETVIMHGRSDATLNRGGVRIGSADLYAVLEAMPGVVDSLVVGIELPDGGYYMPLFIVADTGEDHETLRERVTRQLAEKLSLRHVPDEIFFVDVIPRTRTGKKLEVPIKHLLQGAPMDKSMSVGSITQPDALAWFANFGRERVQPLLRARRGGASEPH